MQYRIYCLQNILPTIGFVTYLNFLEEEPVGQRKKKSQFRNPQLPSPTPEVCELSLKLFLNYINCLYEIEVSVLVIGGSKVIITLGDYCSRNPQGLFSNYSPLPKQIILFKTEDFDLELFGQPFSTWSSPQAHPGPHLRLTPVLLEVGQLQLVAQHGLGPSKSSLESSLICGLKTTCEF